MIDDDKVADAVKAAIEIGYRNIDTVQVHGNERGVGEGVRTSGVAREELFVSTKLDIGYIDLMLIHAPHPWCDFSDGHLAAWKALKEAHQAGKIRAIGVSNFLQPDLENVLQHGTVAPKAHRSPTEPCERIIPIKGIERAPEPFGSTLTLLSVANYR
ncbi:aldo/keto reductase [Spelaeicoccus albus]|uniref:Diketogulonate reductase-like aldo/keto reductase n=1 Tax=Spelaeicoccus albus TaxID=1280376 RepID=A0A7Z0III9_9MICO|nr:aldo/keto reductase [Spelaeicoccus albus]NYI68494.1 diketogulonate reductase-like aldo/keto reductase [Spelaeicoccus albus]